MKASTTIDVRDVLTLTIRTKGTRRATLAVRILQLAAWICRRLGVQTVGEVGAP